MENENGTWSESYLTEILDPNSRIYWVSQITQAMQTLSFQALCYGLSSATDSTPVFEAFDKIGEAIMALQRLGHEVPVIDFTGLPEEFISCMSHPALKSFAKSFELKQQILHLISELRKKWGTVEERRRRIQSAI